MSEATTVRLEVEIEITSRRRDSIEGTWHGADADGWLQAIAADLIRSVTLTDAANGGSEHPWRICSGYDLERLEKMLGVSLFGENGREACEETSHGVFVAWCDGIPI